MNYKKLCQIVDDRKLLENVHPDIPKKLGEILKRDLDRYIDVYSTSDGDISIYRDDKLLADYNSGNKKLKYDASIEKFLSKVYK